MERLFDNSKGFIYQECINWLRGADSKKINAAILIIGNFARNGQLSKKSFYILHSIYIVILIFTRFQLYINGFEQYPSRLDFNFEKKFNY